MWGLVSSDASCAGGNAQIVTHPSPGTYRDSAGSAPGAITR
ncbi:hypothetical protein [Lysobacter gummosus]